uniref:ATP synthase F0 subunit 8 n=1 Tax=Mylabris sibirica TaxID=2921314 RepID=UPI002A7EE104|nr:ATP synthase F0 subunit 8 [Mylabris sibirica]WOE90363.1 ATP synthase F0 subunit 8 [Mylabris sibirica]
MPQMAPLNWLTLMVYFIMIMLILNSLNFYAFPYMKNHSETPLKFKINLNWKWL